MTVDKTVSGRSPYIGKTFQRLTELIAGRSGYVSGASTSDNGATITVEAFAFMQNGLIVEQDAQTTGIAVPTGAEPWFLLGSSADDDPDSGVSLSVTTDLGVASSGTVLAYKTNGVWVNPVALSLQGLEDRNAADPGKEEGLRVHPAITGGNLASLEVTSGKVVDPAGIRRTLAGPAATPTAFQSITPFLPHEVHDRTDHIVLRQNDVLTTEVQYIRGNTEPSYGYGVQGTLVTPSFSGTNDRPHYFHARGGGIASQWWAWGEGNNLRILGGPAGENFAAATLLAGSSTVTDTYIVGQRASDSAIIVVYLDGDDLRIVSFNASTGALVDAAVTIDTQANGITHPRAFLDGNEECHVVYQHDENGTGLDEQVYYTRVSTLTVAFGLAAITPRIPDGAASGDNDTGPVVVVDQAGLAHIVYITGASGTSNTFGELRYSTINRSGTTTFQKTYSNTADVGKDLIPTDDESVELYGNGGTTVDNLREVDLAITPHDEVYAIALLKDSGDAEVFDAALFSPAFEARLGFGVVHFNRGSASTVRYNDCGIVSDEQGQLYCILSHNTGALERLRLNRIDTVFAPNGIVGLSIIGTGPDDISTVSPIVDELLVDKGYGGDVAVSEQDGAGAVSTTTFAFNCNDELDGLASPSLPHPNDIYLASWRVPGEATPVLPEDEVQIFHTREKHLNYPFLVGGDGDFQGCNSLQLALRVANQNQGTVLVRSGRHYLNAPISLAGGVRLIGEGMPVLDFGPDTFNDAMIDIAGVLSITVSAINGQVVTLASNLDKVRSGDLVEMATSGFHRVIRRINDKAVLDGVPPVGATLQLFVAGTTIENFLITGRIGATTDHFVRLFSANKAIVRNCAFKAQGALGGLTSAVLFNDSRECIAESLDFSSWQDTGGTATAITMVDGFGNTVEGCLLAGDTAQLSVQSTELVPRVLGCIDTGAGSLAVYDIAGARAAGDFVVFANNIGELTGASSSFARTLVGERISMSDPTQAMAFEDVNTLAGAAPAGRILLTSATDQEFNSGGSTVGIITEAVNARVQVAGDTMTGDLTMGANVLTDGTKRNLGATGSAATDKYDAFLDDLHLLGDFQLDQDVDVGHLFQGRNSIVPSALTPYGLIEPLGSSYYDDFQRPINVGATSFWAASTGGVSQVADVARCTTTAVDDNQQTLESRESITGYSLPGFSANVQLAGFNTFRRDEIGWDNNPTNNVFSVRRDTDVGTNWFIAFRDDGGTDRTIDTGSSLATVDVYLFITLIMVSPTSILFRISDDQRWGFGTETIVFDSSLPGTGTIEQSATLGWKFRFDIQTRATLTVRTADYGFLNIFSAARPASPEAGQG